MLATSIFFWMQIVTINWLVCPLLNQGLVVWWHRKLYNASNSSFEGTGKQNID